jgi:lipopolysaccharide transport system permease protein
MLSKVIPSDFRKLSNKYYILSAFYLAKVMLGKQYRDSFLGWAWSLLQPTVQIIVYALVFSIIMRFPQKDYAFYLVSGILPWNFMSISIITSCNSLIGRAGTLKQTLISRTIFPVADVLKNFYTFLFAFVAMYGFSLIFFTDFKWQVLLLPVAFLPIFITVISISVVVSFITPYVRDIGEFINMFFLSSFFLTPIIYPISIMPEKYHYLFNFNPMYILIKPVQEVVYYGIVPNLKWLAVSFALSFVIAFMSYILQKALRKNVVYYL